MNLNPYRAVPALVPASAPTAGVRADVQYAFLLDLSRCVGCQGCVAACKTGNELAAKTQFIQIGEIVTGDFPKLTGYVSNHRCYHCTDAACVNVCPTGAMYKENGLTRLDVEPCIGCGECVSACPYEVPKLRNKKSTKCDGCKTVVEAGGEPWCVKTCPSQALMYGERADILAEAQARVEAIKERYPNAQVYGETQAGGLGMLVVLPDDPAVWDLPEDPDTHADAKAQVPQSMAKALPANFGFLSALTLGLGAVIARRNKLGGEKQAVADDETRETDRVA